MTALTPDTAPAAEDRALPGQRYTVTLADGTAFVVRVTNREYLAWDKTAPRKGWGKATDVPFLAQTFTAFAAAKREGLTAATFEAWSEQVETIVPVEADDTDTARPTRPAHALD